MRALFFGALMVLTVAMPPVHAAFAAPPAGASAREPGYVPDGTGSPYAGPRGDMEVGVHGDKQTQRTRETLLQMMYVAEKAGASPETKHEIREMQALVQQLQAILKGGGGYESASEPMKNLLKQLQAMLKGQKEFSPALIEKVKGTLADMYKQNEKEAVQKQQEKAPPKDKKKEQQELEKQKEREKQKELEKQKKLEKQREQKQSPDEKANQKLDKLQQMNEGLDRRLDRLQNSIEKNKTIGQ